MPKGISEVVKSFVFLFVIIAALPSVALAAWNDVSSSFTLSHTDRALDRVKQTFFSYVTVQNTSSQAVFGPLRLVIQNSTIAVTGATGTTESNLPFLKIAEASIPAGAKLTYRVNFVLSKAALSFTARIEQEKVVSSFPPVLRDFKFVELSGREGHEGYFPVFGRPVTGVGFIAATVQGDFTAFSVEVVANGQSLNYTKSSVTQIIGDLSIILVDIEIPRREFNLEFSTTAPDGVVKKTSGGTFAPKDFAIQILKSDHSFSYGENFVRVEITNFGASADFEVVAEDRRQNISPSPVVVRVNSKESNAVVIPIVIPTTGTVDFLNLTVSTRTFPDATTTDVAKLDILVFPEPITYSDSDLTLVVAPEGCGTVNRSDATVTLVIPGSHKLNVEKIDKGTFLINDMPVSVVAEIGDVLSSSNYDCLRQTRDGMKDLVLKLDLQAMIRMQPNATDSLPIILSYLGVNDWKRVFEKIVKINQ